MQRLDFKQKLLESEACPLLSFYKLSVYFCSLESTLLITYNYRLGSQSSQKALNPFQARLFVHNDGNVCSGEAKRRIEYSFSRYYEKLVLICQQFVVCGLSWGPPVVVRIVNEKILFQHPRNFNLKKLNSLKQLITWLLYQA